MKNKNSGEFNRFSFGPMLTMLICFGKIVLFSQNHFHGEIAMNDRLTVPFDLHFNANPKPLLMIHNGNETISMRFIKRKKDTLYFEFPEIAGQLVFHGTTHRGYWLNLNKIAPKYYPFQFYLPLDQKNPRLDLTLDTQPSNYSGKYRVRFNEGASSFNVVGEFEQAGSQVTGTFRAATGDYRYLSGGVVNDTLILSCFDGVHAFRFEAKKLAVDSIEGVFYSGETYRATWQAVVDTNASLTSPFGLSYPIDATHPLVLKVKTMKGKNRTLSDNDFRGHPTVIQIMGTWCPNCLDETRYFVTLKQQPEFDDVRFILVAFENGMTDKDRLKRLKRYTQKIELNYPAFLGGEATTKQAGTVFNALNGVFAFPTTLFLTKQGIIKQVHVGFDGPGTGNHFEELKRDFEELLRQLVQE